MYVRLYVCMYAYVVMGVCMYDCVYVRMCACIYECIYVCMYVCTYVCMCVCTYVCIYACMNVYMYACLYVCMYVYMYVSSWVRSLMTSALLNCPRLWKMSWPILRYVSSHGICLLQATNTLSNNLLGPPVAREASLVSKTHTQHTVGAL